MLNYAKILLKSAKIEQIPAESSKIMLNVGRSSHILMNSQGLCWIPHRQILQIAHKFKQLMLTVNPPPPACRGAGRVEYQSDFVKLSSEGPRTFRRPRRAGHVLATSCRVPIAQNAILEPPKASKMPSWNLRWHPDRQILQMTATLY